MTRILFWLALALLVYFAIRSKLKQSQRRQQQLWEQQQREQQRQAQASASRQVVQSEEMLRCAQCGVYFPASENVPANGRDYCSTAHAPLK